MISILNAPKGRYGHLRLLLCITLMLNIAGNQAALAFSRQTQTVELQVPELDAGFHLLYEFKFEEARIQFDAWQKSHLEDPLGSASEAASYLFEECYVIARAS